MHSAIKPIAAALAALILFVLVGCLLDDKQAGRRGSEVENEVYGILVSAEGSPVAGARVKALPEGAPIGPLNDSGTVLTDARGAYSIRGLAQGTYNLLGDFDAGKLVVLIPGVGHADTSTPDTVGIDTLRAPGRLRGRLLLSGQGFSGAFAYIPGTSYGAVSDDSGRFLISGVPQGRYAVKYSAEGYLIEPDTGVFVPAGAIVDLPVKRMGIDPAFPPPAPRGLKAVFDTALGRVRLAWGAVPVSDLEGYLVYRDPPDGGQPRPVSPGLVRDTVFIDSGLGDPDSIPAGALVYRVKARDSRADLSLTFSAPAEAKAAPRTTVATRMEWIAPRPGADTVAIGDTVRMEIGFANPTRRVVRVEWRIGEGDGPRAAHAIGAREGRDGFSWSAARAGAFRVGVTALDEAGTAWTAERVIVAVGNDLRAIAAGDTLVSAGDTVSLRASARARYGRFAGWAWDPAGEGRFVPASEGVTRLRAPDHAGRFGFVLRVADAFGDTAYDTAFVEVVPDPPRPIATGDTLVSVGDTVRVGGIASDRFGRISAWEWSAGPGGPFRAFPGTQAGVEARFAMPAEPVAAYPLVLRVTDDDGERAEDTVWIRVEPDAPTVRATGDTAVSLGDSVRTHAEAADRLGRIVKYEWRVGEGAFLAAGADAVLPMPRAAAANLPVVVRVTDDDGLTASDTLRVDVLADPPKIAARGDTTVSLGDSVRVSASGSDRFGTVVRYEWRTGPGGAVAAVGAHAVLAMPRSPSRDFPVTATAIDDDGQTASDTVWIRIEADAPTVAAAGDTVVSIGDTVRAAAVASDRYGRIVLWEWQSGTGGAFVEGGPAFAAGMPRVPASDYPLIVRVTDDDGMTALDTVRVGIRLDPPWVDASPQFGDSVSIGDSLIVLASGGDGFGPVSLSWSCGGAPAFVPVTAGRFAYRAPAAPARDFACILRARDDDGQDAFDTVMVQVVADAPIAIIPAFPVAALTGDSARLTANGSADRYGKIVAWDWKCGPGVAFGPSDGDTTIHFTQAGAYACILRVTDDDGQQGFDTASVVVKPSFQISAGSDTTLKPAEWIRLRGIAQVSKSYVKFWAWDIGAKGKFVDPGWFNSSMSTDTVFQAPVVGDSLLKCVLRAQNHDDEVAYDTVIVRIKGRLPMAWERLAMPAYFPKVLRLSKPIEFKGKLWIFGGDTTKLTNDIWSTSDGVNWAKAGKAAWPARCRHAVTEFNGKLWMTGGTEQNMIGTHAVWTSTDGITWTEVAVTTPFPDRHQHSAVPFGGKLCVSGGVNGKLWVEEYRKDTWCSADGKAWQKAAADFPAFVGTSGRNPIALGDGSLIAMPEYGGGGLLRSKDLLAWETQPVKPDTAMGTCMGMLALSDHTLIMAYLDGYSRYGIWHLEADGTAAMDTGPDLGAHHYDLIMVPFQGKIWLWSGGYNDPANPNLPTNPPQLLRPKP